MADLAMSTGMPAMPCTAPTGNITICPECHGLIINGQHQCPPKTTPAQQLNARFTDIYATYQTRVTALVASRIVHEADKHLTDDLTAEAFTQVWLHLHKCEAATEAKLFSWLATIARRTVANHFRLKKNTMERPVDLGDFQFSNRELETADGYYTPATTGFRTATLPAVTR